MKPVTGLTSTLTGEGMYINQVSRGTRSKKRSVEKEQEYIKCSQITTLKNDSGEYLP